MQARVVKSLAGWQWWRCGWELFKRNPPMWLILAMILSMIVGVMRIIGPLGMILLTLLMPFLSAGMLRGARDMDQGRPLQIAHLATAVMDKALRGRLLPLGIILIVISVSMTLLAIAAIGTDANVTGGQLAGFSSFAFLAGVPVFMAYFYAVPLALFSAAKPPVALKTSLLACLKNGGAFFIWFLIYAGLMILALLPMQVGLPPISFFALCAVNAISFCTAYCSYKDVFQTPEPASEPPAPPPSDPTAPA
jgi:uncharacterized membrane protein